MPDPVTGLMAAVSIGGTVLSNKSAKSAANRAANAQVQSDEMAIAEQRAAREEMRRLLDPYVKAGGPALQGQMDLLGLGEDVDQQGAVDAMSGSPLFLSLAEQGEDAILANASATGGLRGGNVQGALAQFRPALLNRFIEDQFRRLGGITTLGQNSAAGVGGAGMDSASAIGSLFLDQGAARAGGALAKGRADSAMTDSFAQLAGMLGPKMTSIF